MKRCFLLLSLCLFSFFVTAQRVELGVLAGGSLYYGDISSNTSRLSNNLQPTRFSYSAMLRWNISDYFAARATFSQMNLGGADMYSLGTRRDRGISFYSKTMTAGLSLELKLHEIINQYIKTPIEPFIGAGVSIVNASPKVFYKNNTIGDNLGSMNNGMSADNIKQSPLMSSALFAHAGLIFPMTDFVKFGIEGTLSRSNTDFLDGVSMPSNAKLFNNDWFMQGGVSLYFNLGSLMGASGLGGNGKSFKCYKF